MLGFLTLDVKLWHARKAWSGIEDGSVDRYYALAHDVEGGRPWLTVAEAAGYLRVNPDFIYDACATGELQHVRLGGRRSIRVRREWLDAWMEGHRQVAA
jgi:excisionase family DNA binding protein